jgi:hypothetical protein
MKENGFRSVDIPHIINIDPGRGPFSNIWDGCTDFVMTNEWFGFMTM